MDIHKPKPWHGLREFLKEYATIVIGVLTALAAEAVVENLHERRLSAEAHEAVRGEIAADLGWMVQDRQQARCVEKRIDEIAAILAAAREGQPHPIAQWIGRPANAPVSTKRWIAAAQSGRAALFDSDEQGAFSTLYFPIEGFVAAQEQGLQAWATLRALEGARTLSPQMIWGLSEALQKARMENFRARRATDRVLSDAKALGITPVAPPHKAMDLAMPPICVPIDTDRATALRMIANPTG
ncbi:hypothetical protein [Phenylobacterium sp.]|jgi:hypothetical protein|uniref:hypothetical protein n=1 Tax=Phenylobacterium sp. TaxID=1871053 RepID=UPI002F3F6EA3